MPRFYFDVLDGSDLGLDDTGTVIESLDEARCQAQEAIGEMVSDAMPDGDEHVTVIRVRDESGRTRLMVSNVMRTVQVE